MHFFGGGGGGGGGFPFGFGGHGHEEQEEHQGEQADTTKYYDFMEVSKEASQDEIKIKYKELAKKYHPDRKGGNVEKFKQLNEIYQTLGDPQKRRAYDKYGPNGPSQDGSDLMNMFFGGGGGNRPKGKKQLPKMKPTKKALNVTLEDTYNGKMMKIPHERTRCCQTCNGKGGENVKSCTTCKGRGRVMQMYQMGPGMYQQVQKNCDTCKGEGEIIAEGGKCKTCNAKKILSKEKVLEVPIEKGIPHGSPIVLNGEGNQIPDTMAGDLIFVVQEETHPIFTRKGADLFMKKKISLAESLCGIDFKVKHLDGNEQRIYTGKGEVIGDGDKKVVRGLGMPFYKDSMSHGNLIIEFNVEMPKRGTLSKEQLEELSKILPGKINERPKDDKYQMLEDFEKENVNTSEEGGHKNIGEEEDEQQSAGGCQAQ